VGTVATAGMNGESSPADGKFLPPRTPAISTG
jgi:hypothetical protein